MTDEERIARLEEHVANLIRLATKTHEHDRELNNVDDVQRLLSMSVADVQHAIDEHQWDIDMLYDLHRWVDARIEEMKKNPPADYLGRVGRWG